VKGSTSGADRVLTVFRPGFALLIALPAFGQVQADVAALTNRLSLAAWQKAHPGERQDRAHYETSADGYQVDFLRENRWCAASVGRTPEGIARTALFYVPSPPGAASALPVKQDPALTRDCELDAIWYETQDEQARGNIVRELTEAWGQPADARVKPTIAGAGLWKDVVSWHRPDIDIWAGRNPRLVVYAARNLPSDWDLDHWFGGVLESQARVADAVARIAALGPALTSPILSGSRCSAGPSTEDRQAAEPLAKWLAAARSPAPVRRAAALLLTDFYITCAGTSPDSDPLQKGFAELGAKYETRSPEDGPDYAHNFREQAERLDPHGPAGQLAGLVSLTDPCFLKGANGWPDLLIEKGTKMLNAFPSTRWTPYVHFALARAHATKLSFALPGGDPEGGNVSPLGPATMQQERSAAISHLRYFLKRQPGAPESVFAWQEAWRLLAGLPPSRIHFGCSGE